MSRKDYELIASLLKAERNGRTGQQLVVIDSLALRFAESLEVEGGFDVNGNRRFKSDRFLTAAGVGVCINPEEAA